MRIFLSKAWLRNVLRQAFQNYLRSSQNWVLFLQDAYVTTIRNKVIEMEEILLPVRILQK